MEGKKEARDIDGLALVSKYRDIKIRIYLFCDELTYDFLRTNAQGGHLIPCREE